MNYLLDTNVISELVTPKPDPSIVHWFELTDEDQLFISVISLAEIRRGIELLATGRRRERLNAWSLNQLPARFEGRILPVDPAVAAGWGRLMAQGQAAGRSISTMDAFIAATALCYSLTLVTRNVSDFAATGITLLNPWLAIKSG